MKKSIKIEGSNEKEVNQQCNALLERKNGKDRDREKAQEKEKRVWVLELEFSLKKWVGEAGQHPVRILFTAMNSGLCIQSLILRDCNLGTLERMLQLSSMLIQNNATVTALDLSRNSLTDVFCPILMDSLKLNKSVRDLNLSENWIGDLGASQIAEGITLCQLKLIHIDLQWNLIGEEGGKRLAEAIKSSEILQSLYLVGNGDIRSESFDHIWKAMNLNQKFKKASDLFVFIMLHSDGYLTINEKNNDKGIDAKRHFLKITGKLPTELQMILCNRCYDVRKLFISSFLIEKSLYTIIRHFVV